MLDSWRERRAIRRVLGSGARIERRIELRRTGGARTVAVTLVGDASRYVLKRYGRAEHARREAAALEAVGGLEGVGGPRCFGESRGWVVRQFVEGRTLAETQRESGSAYCQPLYAAAVVGLAAIHSARDVVESRVRLDDPFGRAALASRLRRAFERIEKPGFARYAARAGKLPESWSTLASADLVERLTEDLHTAPQLTVLGHGDYCAANLVVTPMGEVVGIDWDQLSLATPWRDLGRLLRCTSQTQRPDLLKRYLTAMRGAGCLSSLSESRAPELLESGILYDCVLVARIAAKSLRSRNSELAIEEFREAMDTLVQRTRSD